jgi:Domain of unknown function (DUF4476)
MDTMVKVVPPPVKSETLNPVGKAVVVKKEVPAKVERPVNKASIFKLKSVRLAEGWRLTYIVIDKSGRADTIQLIIPYEKPDAPIVDTVVPKTDSVLKPAPDTVKAEVAPVAKIQPVVVNPACREMASDHDIDVMRVSVLTEQTQVRKLAAAKKSLKSKCITVKQVRALSELFVSDGTRYEFFEAMYPIVQDRGNFLQLADLLIDHGYNSKFKTSFGQ